MKRRFPIELILRIRYTHPNMDELATQNYKNADIDLKLLRAQAEHAPGVDLLYRQLVNDPDINVSPWAVNAISQDPTNHLFVAELNGLVVGTAFLVIGRDVMYQNQPFAIIENIIVDEKRQGQGIGKKLMAYMEEICRSYRCTKIMLLSSAGRHTAHKFFENCGYRSDIKCGFVNYLNS